MIDCIIYSKDRTSQTDLLLRSIKDMFVDVGEVFLLYTWSNPDFREGFKRILEKKYGLNIIPITQDNFQSGVNLILDMMESDSFLGLCDDDVFIKQTDCSEIVRVLEDTEISSISLKAGLNITKQYPNFDSVHPQFVETSPFLKWEWRKADKMMDWGYPTCVNSYIFKKDYYKELIKGFAFHCPPYLEMGLNINKERFRKYIVSLQESTLLNIPANRLQTLSPNAFASKYYYDITDLNRKFLDGYVISTKGIYNSPMTMGNEEREFFFEKQ